MLKKFCFFKENVKNELKKTKVKNKTKKKHEMLLEFFFFFS